jgi:hypothetical protein
MKKKRLKYMSLSIMLILALTYFKYHIGRGISRIISLKDIKW